MEVTAIIISNLPFLAINVPLVCANLIANIFFAFCLIFPPLNKDGLKQPLNLLLGSLICCTIVYLISFTANYCVLCFLSGDIRYRLYNFSYLVVWFSLYVSMTSSVWLNFFYYTQIVPAHRALFIWVKRNIKSIIYCALFVDRMFYLFVFSVSFAYVLVIFSLTPGFIYVSSYTNATYNNMTLLLSDVAGFYALFYTNFVCFVMQTVYLLVCMCVMMVSSFTTVRYLHRHIRSMSVSGSPFSSPRLQSQVRVTVTGILQGVFYLFGAAWILLESFSTHFYTTLYVDLSATYTVIALYMSGTTVNLALGQTLFRHRAAEVWHKAVMSLRHCG